MGSAAVYTALPTSFGAGHIIISDKVEDGRHDGAARHRYVAQRHADTTFYDDESNCHGRPADTTFPHGDGAPMPAREKEICDFSTVRLVFADDSCQRSSAILHSRQKLIFLSMPGFSQTGRMRVDFEEIGKITSRKLLYFCHYF